MAIKDNMEGDYSDLKVNTFIVLAREYFWEEKKLVWDELNIPKTISALWHATKNGSDSWKAKYLPEVLNYEKKGQTREGAYETNLVHQEIDLLSLAVFVYFYLTKLDTLYKKMVYRIKIWIVEFLTKGKDLDELVRSKEQSAKSVEGNVFANETVSSDSE